ncbi:MAG: hypothetical protein AAGA31_03745 [Bacteroidota bacterium]
MLSPRLKRTLIYCLIAFVVIVPIYYVVYGFIGKDFAPGERLNTSLMYGFINVLFLGALHYFFANRGEKE